MSRTLGVPVGQQALTIQAAEVRVDRMVLVAQAVQQP
jgi:hypothetical protein